MWSAVCAQDVDLFSAIRLRYGVGPFSPRLQTSNNALCIIVIFRQKVWGEMSSDSRACLLSFAPGVVVALVDACVSYPLYSYRYADEAGEGNGECLPSWTLG